MFLQRKKNLLFSYSRGPAIYREDYWAIHGNENKNKNDILILYFIYFTFAFIKPGELIKNPFSRGIVHKEIWEIVQKGSACVSAILRNWAGSIWALQKINKDITLTVLL